MSAESSGFDFICRIVAERTGNVLEADKAYLAKSRLLPVAQRWSCPSVKEVIAKLQASRDPQLEREVVEAMLTHETSFFRDEQYFANLSQHILPALLHQRQAERCLRIWCCACASGQEAYSIGMLLRESFSDAVSGWDVEILGSDCSYQSILQAVAGEYSEVEMTRGLSARRRDRYFQRQRSGWQLNDSLRAAVQFRELNLIKPLPTLPPMDLVLLRNALIYMSDDTKRTILRRVHQTIRPGGFLILGATETLFDLKDRFDRISFDSSLSYQKRPL
ncbi:MAG: protein-glutamate O-methyltransferase CheR [Planctomycetes bacterium]|nr:protein-glutamate O-methyltransferase CheR [Planctomycetota bacterium]